MKSFFFFAALLISAANQALAWPGVVLNVHDGDTVNIAPGGDTQTPVAVRLYGIDAPELDQPGGTEAAHWLQNLLGKGETVEVIPYGVDSYDRALGLVLIRGRAVNAAMVSEGHAWVYQRYCRANFCRKWQKEQQKAALRKLGVWQGEPTPPWQWRKTKRNAEKEP